MLRAKYPWLRCDESFQFISKMAKDLPTYGHLVKAQEKRIVCLEYANYRLHEFIRVNRLADEAIIAHIAQKFNLEL